VLDVQHGSSDRLEARALCELVHLITREGNFAQSLEYAQQASAIAQALADQDLIMDCMGYLALAERFLGRFEDSQGHYQQVLDHERSLGRHISMLRTLSDMGLLLIDLNQPLEARALFSEGLELSQTHAMPYELSFMWEGLSLCSHLLGEHDLAKQQALTALDQTHLVGDTIGVAAQSINLGKIFLALNEQPSAKEHLKRALQITWEKKNIPEVLKVVLVWAQILASEHHTSQAGQLLTLVLIHPSSEAISRIQAQDLLERLNLPPLEPQTLARAVAGLLYGGKELPIDGGGSTTRQR
jgi:tetratricopeptide (TPR) repeat protein